MYQLWPSLGAHQGSDHWKNNLHICPMPISSIAWIWNNIQAVDNNNTWGKRQKFRSESYIHLGKVMAVCYSYEFWSKLGTGPSPQEPQGPKSPKSPRAPRAQGPQGPKSPKGPRAPWAQEPQGPKSPKGPRAPREKGKSFAVKVIYTLEKLWLFVTHMSFEVNLGTGGTPSFSPRAPRAQEPQEPKSPKGPRAPRAQEPHGPKSPKDPRAPRAQEPQELQGPKGVLLFQKTQKSEILIFFWIQDFFKKSFIFSSNQYISRNFFGNFPWKRAA
jgi:hypothetical protein